MRYKFVVLFLFLSACQQPATTSFSERVAQAETLEKTPSGAIFIGALLKEHGESINAFTGQCYATSNLEKDSFTVVFDIDQNGYFKNIVVQPESTPTRCYADKLSKLRTKASRPIGFANKTFPIVINVNYNK